MLSVQGNGLFDTNVFTAWLKPRSPLVQRYARHGYGNRLAIAQGDGGRSPVWRDRSRPGHQAASASWSG
jgi:hypothetical protein